jgi:hypothetical protein
LSALPSSRRDFLRVAAAVLAGSMPVAALASPAFVEPVHAVDTLAADPYLLSPPHLIEAEQIVDYLSLPACPVANNTYKAPGDPNVVI